MGQASVAKSTAIFPSDRDWELSGKGSPHVGVIVGGPQARSQQIEYLILIYGMMGAGAAAAVWWLFTHPTGWVEWSGFVFFYLLCNFGLSVGFHRYFSHRSFQTSRFMHGVLAVTGQMASIGSVIAWSADHRRHHAFTNVPGDPYAPRVDGHGRPMKGLWSFYMSHIGWLLDNTSTDLKVYGKGLAGDPILEFVHKTRYFWGVFSMVLAPAAWGWLFGGTTQAVIGTVLVAGFLRTFIFANGVAFTNSLAHGWGYQNFPEKDGSTNNWFVALLTLGDGWHNNHHNAARVASNQVNWWEFDPNGWTIHGMEKLGLAWNVQRRTKRKA